MNRTSALFGVGCVFGQRGCQAAAMIAVAGVVSCAHGQIIQEPIAATLTYQVTLPGGAWGSSAIATPGQRVEWRAVLNFTGTTNAAALGRIFYQPVLSNVNNVGSGTQVDRLGEWRNAGASGQGNTTLGQGLLSVAEGNNSSALASYGRVHYGFTSRSTTAGNSGALTGHRHTDGSDGAPAGSHIRIAGSNATQWYEPGPIPNPTLDIVNRSILWGVVSDNNAPTNSWFQQGTQGIVIFRQSFIAGSGGTDRTVAINSEAATLQRAVGTSGPDDTRFMTWALPGEGGSTATIRAGVQYVGAEIIVFIDFPSPSVLGTVLAGAVIASRQRKRDGVVQLQQTNSGGAL